MRICTLDFETEAIEPRPKYPPKPVGLAVRKPESRKSYYLAFGHIKSHGYKDDFNSCKEEEAVDEWYSNVGDNFLFHNAKFDLEVARKHWGFTVPKWNRIHETMFLLFLLDPHAKSFALKPAAEHYLSEPPGEKDELVAWILSNIWRENKTANTEVVVSPTKPKHYLKVPPTKAMAYIKFAPLHLTSKYGKGDTDRTYKLFKKLYPEAKKLGMGEAYDRERRLLPILMENENAGIRTDLTLLKADRDKYIKALEKTDRYIKKTLDKKDLNISSDQELADALEERNVVTEWHYTEKSGQKSVAKDKLLIKHFRNNKLALALAYRNRLTTCMSTFIQPWVRMAESNKSYIHTSWNQVRQVGGGFGVGARTGRLSSSPNFMNIPTDFEDKGDGYKHPTFLRVPHLPMMRDYLIADRKCVLIGCDYSQQELRILAHFSGGRLLKEFNRNPKTDVHVLVKDLVKKATNVDFPRKYIKTINFGIIYGMGLASTAAKLGLPIEDTRELQAAHKKALPEVYDFIFETKRQAKMGNPTVTWGGRRYFPEPPVNGRTFEYKLVNYKIQGSAGDCTKESIIRYSDAKQHGRFWLTVHDENVISVPREHVTKEKKILIDAMQSVEFKVPMLVDSAKGFRWGACK